MSSCGTQSVLLVLVDFLTGAQGCMGVGDVTIYICQSTMRYFLSVYSDTVNLQRNWNIACVGIPANFSQSQ